MTDWDDLVEMGDPIAEHCHALLALLINLRPDINDQHALGCLYDFLWNLDEQEVMATAEDYRDLAFAILTGPINRGDKKQ